MDDKQMLAPFAALGVISYGACFLAMMNSDFFAMTLFFLALAFSVWELISMLAEFKQRTEQKGNK